MSVGDMVTAPVAVASSDTSNCSSPLPISGISLTSASALFLLEEREDEDPVNLDTVTREDGLGDSFSLKQEEKNDAVGINAVATIPTAQSDPSITFHTSYPRCLQ